MVIPAWIAAHELLMHLTQGEVFGLVDLRGQHGEEVDVADTWLVVSRHQRAKEIAAYQPRAEHAPHFSYEQLDSLVGIRVRRRGSNRCTDPSPRPKRSFSRE